MDKSDNAKKILEAYKKGVDEGKNSTSFSNFFYALGEFAMAPITPENNITKAKELGREEGIRQGEEIEAREKEEEERVSAIEEARQEIIEDIYDSLSRRYSEDYPEGTDCTAETKSPNYLSRRYSDDYSYSEPSNTNIGATTERDTFCGVVFIVAVIIAGIVVGIIYYKEHNSGPLRHPEPTSFSVIIDSSPSGATVFIDKKEVGITPFSITLEKGSYGVRVEKEGYENDYKITEGEDLEFNLKSKEE